MKFFEYNLTLSINDVDFFDRPNSKPIVVDCLNPHSFVVAESDPLFKQALINSDLLLPDGVGICMEVKKWMGQSIQKIAGDDFHKLILNQLNERGGKLFYMGSTEKVLEGIRNHIAQDYPNIKVMTHSPSYSKEFSTQENAEIIAKIESFAPDALMVGLTAPKQEKWIFQNVDRLTTPKVIGAVGGVFEFFSGTIKRAPEWAIRLKAEWLWRFMKEPKRMWERNFVSTPKFLRYCQQHHHLMSGQ